ncbi:MAG: hypothetical protein EP349_00985 [Alphaproteobacteria bacterium]|nr:MAG: hypothetical protein EP349_00985 [Alphaproteobacteria bacterium]
MKPRPKIKLSRLRDIGWSLWDPIGLLPDGDLWTNKDNSCFADEYDSYLLQAAGQLKQGVSDAEVIDYLMKIETEYMGLGERRDTRKRAEAVVAAIHGDLKLWTSAEGNN